MQSFEGVIAEATIDGQEIRFFVADAHDLIQREHAVGRFYEPEELAIIAEFFPRSGVFVDIGANVANHSVYVGRYLAPKAIVIFEPNPLVIPALRFNIMLNGLQPITDLSHLGIGLSNAAGTARAWTPPGNLGATWLEIDNDVGGLTLLRGDDVLAARQVDFLKIDVEGMEVAVLEGLAETIARCRPAMFVEVDNRNAEAFLAWVERSRYRTMRTFRRYEVNENFLILPAEAAGGARPGRLRRS